MLQGWSLCSQELTDAASDEPVSQTQCFVTGSRTVDSHSLGWGTRDVPIHAEPGDIKIFQGTGLPVGLLKYCCECGGGGWGGGGGERKCVCVAGSPRLRFRLLFFG